jgi:SnoaL-like domain
VKPADFDAWVQRYAEACRANSADMARDLFAADAVYVGEPFRQTWVGREQILAEWEDDPAQLEGFECTIEPVVFDERTRTGAAKWWASYPRFETKEFKSAILAWFDAAGRCTRYEEYYRGGP